MILFIHDEQADLDGVPAFTNPWHCSLDLSHNPYLSALDRLIAADRKADPEAWAAWDRKRAEARKAFLKALSPKLKDAAE